MKQQYFDGRIDIVPVANPNIFSMSQRVSLAQEQLQLAQANPDMHNIYEAFRRMYAALGVDNIEQILPPPAQPAPMDAVTENAMAQGALTGKLQLQAFPEQDHDAHIQTHLAYMSSKVVQLNPALISVMQGHIFQHLNLKAVAIAQQQMQQQQPEMQQQPMSPEMQQQPDPQMDTLVAQILSLIHI